MIPSVAVLAEILLRSTRKISIFIIKKCIQDQSIPKKCLFTFEKSFTDDPMSFNQWIGSWLLRTFFHCVYPPKLEAQCVTNCWHAASCKGKWCGCPPGYTSKGGGLCGEFLASFLCMTVIKGSFWSNLVCMHLTWISSSRCRCQKSIILYPVLYPGQGFCSQN